MVSRRTFFSITVMMAALFFLFVFSGVTKENWNNYETNEYISQSAFEKDSLWEARADKLNQPDVVFIGKEQEKGVCQTVRQWCRYTKRSLIIYEKASAYVAKQQQKPQVVVVDSSAIDFGKEFDSLKKLADAGINIIFSETPDLETLKKNPELMKLYGIGSIVEEKKEIEGVRLFSGFLLGGEVIYQAKTKEEKKQQDLELMIPWFLTATGTKTYMVGVLKEEEDVKNEFFPGLIWRNSYGDAQIFVVNGTYLCENTGLGILSAMMAEMNAYDLYPIVNAQNLTVLNYPGFANENEEQMQELYSRTQPSVCKDVIWQNLTAVTQRNKMKLTCLLSPQLDYEDANEPDNTDLTYYMKILKEQDGEIGLSTSRIGDTFLWDKLGRDHLFWNTKAGKYKLSAYYALPYEMKKLASMTGSAEAPDLRTIASDYEPNADMLHYLNDQVTVQRATIDGFSHMYSEDMRARSLETALGYSNIMVDMQRVLWPDKEEDRWEKLSVYFAKYSDTYWKGFSDFEMTTLSQSDCRVRRFLALDYEQTRAGNTITLNIDQFEEEAWFILRTHDEDVIKVSGGGFTKLEEDAWLIDVKKERAIIQLKPEETKSFFYLD